MSAASKHNALHELQRMAQEWREATVRAHLIRETLDAAIREAVGLTQDEIADATGLSRGRIGQIRSG